MGIYPIRFVFTLTINVYLPYLFCFYFDYQCAFTMFVLFLLLLSMCIYPICFVFYFYYQCVFTLFVLFLL